MKVTFYPDGEFVINQDVVYVGGETTSYSNVDSDKICYFSIE